MKLQWHEYSKGQQQIHTQKTHTHIFVCVLMHISHTRIMKETQSEVEPE